jgi:acyl-CoA synthetase (AMP-forming)/AMP-acid ligase II
MRTHRQHLSNVLNILAHVPHYDDDRATVSSPLSAGFAISMLAIYACRGIPTFLLPKFDLVDLLETIERERITIAYAIGATFDQFAQYPRLGDFDLSSLRRFTGSSAIQNSREGMRRMRALDTFRAGFFNAYGSSEAGGYVTFHQADELEQAMLDDAYAHRLESLGREAQFSFIDCLGEDMNPVPAGEVGEMVVRCPSIFSGYWNLPGETAEVLKKGRLYTGDLISKDGDGFIYYRGRKRDMIKSGGLSVYPAEVERVLANHQDISQVAVIGVPDARWGEKVVAYVVANMEDGVPVTESEILEYSAARLAGHKRPKEVVLLDDLPKNAAGKVVKRELRENYRQKNRTGGVKI